MEVSALKHRPALRGPTPFLRLQSDERLVALTRRGNQSAYEVLVARYQGRLLAFCRHMLASKEDAEDVLQEVFAAAFSAMMADERAINVRPWLYRIARNRSLNHLRKQTAIGVDSMDVHLAEHGTSTADKVHKREEFRQLVSDVQDLPETQRTALLLREIDALSYDQIAQAMETTVPAIKSLLVRARVSLAEAAEARALSCEEVRAELGAVAEGLQGKTPPVRRHLRSCERCKGFDKSLTQTNRALAAIYPVGPLLLLKKFLLAQGASSAAGAASAAGTTAATGAGMSAGTGAFAAGLSAVATKTAAVMAGAAIVTAGAVEVDHSRHTTRSPASAKATAAPPRVAAAPPVAAAVPEAPRVVASTPQPVQHSAAKVQVISAAALAERRERKAAAKQRATAAAERAEARKAAEAAPTVAVAVTASTGTTGATVSSGTTSAGTTGTTKPTKPVDTGSDVSTLPGSTGNANSSSTSSSSGSGGAVIVVQPASPPPATAQPAPPPAQPQADPAAAQPAPADASPPPPTG